MQEEVRVVFENAEEITVGSDTPVPLVYYHNGERIVVGEALVKADGTITASVTTQKGVDLLSQPIVSPYSISLKEEEWLTHLQIKSPTSSLPISRSTRRPPTDAS